MLNNHIILPNPYKDKTDFDSITKRPDGSFVIDDIFHVPANDAKYAKLYDKVRAYAEANPDKVVEKSPYKEVTQEDLLKALRDSRNYKLSLTDYLVVPDYPIDVVKLEEVKAYRTALRDITELEGCPWDGGGVKTPWPKNPLE